MNAERIRLLAALAAVLTCAACGNKGSLYLPGDAAAPAESQAPSADTAAGGESDARGGEGEDDRDGDRSGDA